MSAAMPLELRLAARCCRWHPAESNDEYIRELAARDLDWSRFAAIVRRNRITPVVWHALNHAGAAVPEEIEAQFRRQARTAGKQALTLTRESLRIQQAIQAKGLPVMIVKGAPLAMLAYGDLGMKEAADIDVLVSPQTAMEARRLLREIGYDISLEKLTEGQFARYVRHSKEASFFNPRIGVKVDLHWRLVTNKTLLRGVGVNGPAQYVEVPGGSLRTLSDEALFAYLCVHGGLHNWNRLKWLADLGAFLERRTKTEVASLYEAAIAFEVGRSTAVAIALCGKLQGLSFDESVSGSIRQDVVVDRLAENAIAGLAHCGGAVKHERHTVPWLRLKAAQCLLAPGWKHAFNQIRLIWNSPYDRAIIPLPQGFEFGYHLLRLPLWLGRTGRRALLRVTG